MLTNYVRGKFFANLFCTSCRLVLTHVGLTISITHLALTRNVRNGRSRQIVP
jgi:hypothetical protein